MINNKEKIVTPISIFFAILYIVSFIFAQEEKIELFFLLLITLSIVIIACYGKSDDFKESENDKKYKRDIYIFGLYFIVYYVFMIINIRYSFIPTDYINFVLLLFIPCFVARVLGYKFADLGFTGKNIRKALILSVISLGVITMFISSITFKQYIIDNKTGITSAIVVYIIAFVMTFILADIPEEFFFRVILQTRIEKLFNNAIDGIIISSIIFAIYHIPYRLLQNNSLTYGSLTNTIFSIVTQQFLIGLFLSIVWRKTRNIYGIAIIHSCYNAYFLMSTIKL